MPYKQNTEEILNLLKCVECGASALIIKQDVQSNWAGYGFCSGGFCLVCDNCRNRFPITDDGIPILWTSQIKEILRGDGKLDNKNEALFTNISHYNRISDDYSVNFRRDDSLAKRIRIGAKRLLSKPCDVSANQANNKYHLDIGCGPGHVLEWLYGITSWQIGLDVSLANLRNARKSTGAYVVLGDATSMPFRDDLFSLVSGASVLHHISDWRKAIWESCRVCSKTIGGVLYDSDPTFESLSLSLPARFVFEMRYPIYKFLSYFDSKKIHFRDMALAKAYYTTVEVHNQPGRGFSAEEVEDVFRSAYFNTEIFLSPNEHLQMRQTIPWNEAGWKRIILHLLSGHNPLLSRYGSFTVLAVPHTKKNGTPQDYIHF
jgi:ubiquinone/menaquinone biosynthesis C-methylase UbiE